ncbi:MAG TPA: TRAM domain-containing protein [Desulfomonilaceae bacterium]|nr:TRAM domain-containing protein [Desulfomonilaceae bacterium]
MPSKTLSIALVLISILFMSSIGWYLNLDQTGMILSAVVGLALGLVCLRFLHFWLKIEAYKILGGAIGSIIGAILGMLISLPVTYNIESPQISGLVYGLAMAIMSLIGMQLGSTKAWELKRKIVEPSDRKPEIMGILDTSVIIDGRIADICGTGFFLGDLIIPQFVLKELQMIADSSDSTKRTRGRRGLDILNRIQKQSYMNIVIDETDYPTIKEVDQKLIAMAKETGHPIITNDFNLNKVAEVHSIQVLNINQLANALKPIVLPGENIRVQIMKEGKEHGQGVAYLDDGTMVVIDNGRRHMGKNVDVTVTSVLQTTAGRMIFATVKA